MSAPNSEPVVVNSFRVPHAPRSRMVQASICQESAEPMQVDLLLEHASLLEKHLYAASQQEKVIGVGDLRRFWKPAVECLVNNAVFVESGLSNELTKVFDTARAPYDAKDRPPRVGPLAVRAVDQMALTE